MNSRHKPTFGCILLLLFTLRSALAVDLSADARLNTESQEAIAPAIGVVLRRDSNVYNTNTGEVDSWIGVLSPAVLLVTPPANRRFALLYEGEYAHYFNDSADNYDDHALSGAARFQFGSRGQLDLGVATRKGHQGRGGDQVGGLDPSSPSFPSEPDEFDHQEWGARFRYGADGNRGRLRFEIGGDRHEFSNNRQRTQAFDYDADFAGVGLTLRFHQRTAFVMDARFTDVRFPSTTVGEPTRDSKDWRYLVGMTWAATAKTVGSARVGVQQRRFDDPATSNTSNPTWEIELRWSPREHSHFDFATARANQETFDEGAFIDSVVSSATWTHEWNRGWESVVQWSQVKFDFIDSARDQDLREYYLALRLPQGRLLVWELGYRMRSRDSSLERYVYDGNMFSIGVNVRR